MKVLITTPNGKVGHNIAEELLKREIPVRIGAHTVSKAEAAYPTAEVVPFDIQNMVTIEAALEGITHLYFAVPSQLDSTFAIEALQTAQAKGVKRVVNLSAMGVENGDSPMRRTELFLEGSNLEWTILRPTWFMQNFSTSSAPSISNGVLAEPADDGKTAFIDVRDIAAVGVEALLNDGHQSQHYGLTGSEAISRYQVAEFISQAIGKPVQYIPQSDEDFRAAMQAYLPPNYIETLSFLYSFVRQGWSETVTDTVKQVLGRDPISFQQFAQDHREVWLQTETAY